MRRNPGKIRLRIGKNIRRLRRLRAWSQDALAERLDSIGKTIGRMERGESNIRIDTLASVATALGCDVVDLVRGGSNDGSTYVIREADLTRMEEGLRVAEQVRRAGRL
jgi:transcriptional regulator with XRE-family HTH domain